MSDEKRSEDEKRWLEYDEIARRIVLCTDPTCTPDNHVQSVRYALYAAFNEGWIVARRSSPDTNNEREGK